MTSKLPYKNNLPIKALASAFNNTTNSYKLYWFFAILKIIKFDDCRIISIEKIIIEMISSAWFTVLFFKISLGKQDQITKIVKKIIANSELTENSQEEIIKSVIHKLIQDNSEIKSAINQLSRYVPYRFLTPFFSKELRGVLDSQKNISIKKLADESFNKGESFVLYKFVGESIELQGNWLEYLNKNIALIEGFCLWKLSHYLQSRNPNMPNIGKKLFAPPSKRNLSKSRKIWDCVLEKKELSCIFSKVRIKKGDYSIDHFIPWSFVMHDMNWNLCPLPKAVNSSKNNRIPELEKYFLNFSEIQYGAFQIIYNLGKKRLIEDYSIIFNDHLDVIFKYKENIFKEKLYNQLSPLSQIAINAGFSGGWTYRD